MAHTKAQGAANRTVNIVGKRLGIKRYSGQLVKSGTIIIRQRGSRYHAGKNSMLAKDFTVFATADGYVSFRNMTGHHRGQKYIDILPTLIAAGQAVTKIAASKKSNDKKATKVTSKPEVKSKKSSK